MDNVYPNGASTLSKVSSCGVDFRLSILAIAGCFTPLNSASSLCEYPFFSREKILTYLKALAEYGTRIGSPIVKHIDGSIWELRPLKNRIFFFYWKDNKFVLLHYYIKKSQKAPVKEIDKARKNLREFLERTDKS